MTFEEKKSLRDEHKALVRKLCFHNGDWLAMQRRLDPAQEIIQEHDRLKAQADKIMARLNYPKIVTEGNAHADEIKAAWSEYWEGNPPHPNFDWDEMPEHLA